MSTVPRISVSVDCTVLFRRMRNYPKVLGFAVQSSLNGAAGDVQKASHRQVDKRFIVRKRTFMFGTPARPGGVAGRITTFASVKQKRPYAEVGVGASQWNMAAKRRTLLPIYELGGDRKPMTPGAKSVAVPLLGRPARPSIKREVVPEYTFAGLKLRGVRAQENLKRKTGPRTKSAGVFGEFGRLAIPTGRTDAREFQWKGRNRTFLLASTAKEPFGGVFQRIGRGRGGIREIYAFRRDIKLKPALGFYALARSVAPDALRHRMNLEAIESIRRGRLLS